jgi:tetratricopeptide (TPR) repeat protein
MLYMQKGDHERALADFNTAARLAPNDPRLHYGRAGLLALRDENDKAVEAFTIAIALQPDFADAFLGRGMALCSAGKFEEGLADMAKALDLRPDHHHTHGMRARFLRQLKRYDEALTDYREAVRLAPDDPENLNSLAWCLAICPEDRLRDGPAARELAAKACALAGEPNFMYLDTLAAALAESGEHARAVETMEQALRLVPREHREAFRERLRLYRGGKTYRE